MSLHQFIINNNIQPADAIVVKKASGILDHYVIYLGQDDYGNHYFIANMERGVTLIPEHKAVKFLHKYQPKKINRFVGTENERRIAIQRAYAYPNKDNYNLILNNCEHFSSYVQEGRKSSSQVKTAAGVGLGVVLGALLLGALFGGGDNDNEA